MKPTHKLFIIGFVATAVPYGFVICLFDCFTEDTVSVLKILFSASFFGLLMSALFVKIQEYKMKKNGYPKLSNDILKLKQVKYVETILSKKDLFNKLKESEYFKKCKFKETPTSIIINKRISWFSWGEKITVYFNDGDNRIKIESKPVMPLTLIDYGVNLTNVDNVVKIINKVDAV